MSLSKPKTCCMVGLFSGSSAVQRYPTRRHSTISLVESPPSLSLESIASPPRPSLTSLLTHPTFSPLPCSPVINSINTTPKQYTSYSNPQSLLSKPTLLFFWPTFRSPKSATRGSMESERRMLDATRWP